MAPNRQPVRRTADDPEAGLLLIGAVVMCALILIALAVAAPVVAKDLRRDKEVESEHRAEQYVRAIQLYQRACKCKSYPANMDALEKSTTVRFLRKRYVDPLTGKSDWRLIHNPKTTIKGFFGQDLGGLTAGLGSAAGMASPGGIGSTPGSSTTSTIGQTSALASGFSGASITTGTAGTPGTTGTTGGTDNNVGMFGDSSDGGVIYGVGTSKSGDSILTPNQQSTYETWEFWYDPRVELLKATVNILGGGGPGGTSASGGGVSSTDASAFGQGLNGQSNSPHGSNNTFGGGTSGGFGGTPTTPSSGSNPFP
jgi:type II secretory pathway pseudopilin PulG